MAPSLTRSRAERGPNVHIRLDRLRAVREQLGWTQQELAVKAHLTVSSVNRLENGHQSPTLATALMLAVVTGQRIEDLLHMSPEYIAGLRAADVTVGAVDR